MRLAMQLMLYEIIEKELKIREIIEIMRLLSFVQNDRERRDSLIQKRILEDNAELRKYYEERIKWAEDDVKEDINDAEAVLRKYELEYDVDELLG